MLSRSPLSWSEGFSQRQMKSCFQAWVRNENRIRGGCFSVWTLSWQVVGCCMETLKVPAETSQLLTWKPSETSHICPHFPCTCLHAPPRCGRCLYHYYCYFFMTNCAKLCLPDWSGLTLHQDRSSEPICIFRPSAHLTEMEKKLLANPTKHIFITIFLLTPTLVTKEYSVKSQYTGRDGDKTRVTTKEKKPEEEMSEERSSEMKQETQQKQQHKYPTETGRHNKPESL